MKGDFCAFPAESHFDGMDPFHIDSDLAAHNMQDLIAQDLITPRALFYHNTLARVR